MDIVLNGFCKRFVSVQKILAKSTTYRCYPHCPQLPVDNSNLAICLWITFDGGEGVVSVGQSCGSIRPTEKAKIGKGATHHYPAIKKRGVGAGSSKCLTRQPMSLYLGYYAPTVITLAY